MSTARILTLYRRRARSENLSFALTICGLMVVMAQIWATERSVGAELLRLRALPRVEQAERLRTWHPAPSTDALLELGISAAGRRTALTALDRADVEAQRNCSRFVSYDDVVDLAWCSCWSVNAALAKGAGRAAKAADATPERTWKLVALLLQALTSCNAVALVILVLHRFVVNAQILDERGMVHRASAESAAGGSRGGRRVRFSSSLRVALACGATPRNRARLLRLFVELILAGLHVPVLVSDWYLPTLVWVGEKPLLFHYHASDINVVLWLRWIWPLFRTLRNRSVFSGGEQARALALRTAGGDASVGGTFFAFKMAFRERPARLIVILALFTTLSCASIVWVFEKACPHGIVRFTDCLWLTLVTMTSVGYGDLYAVTPGGKTTLFFGGLLAGSLFVSLMTAAFIRWSELGARDLGTVNEIDRSLFLRKQRRHAAKMIQRMTRWSKARRRHERARAAASTAADVGVGEEDAAKEARAAALDFSMKQNRALDSLDKWQKLRRLPEHLRTENAGDAAAAAGSGGEARVVATAAATGRSARAPLLWGGDRGWAAVVSGQRALRNAVQRMAEEFERIELRVQRLRTSQRQGSRIE
tara:strand:- start:64 stop:1842 length:1779 start_codon:yes stop_codon:yes gene_type:complete